MDIKRSFSKRVKGSLSFNKGKSSPTDLKNSDHLISPTQSAASTNVPESAEIHTMKYDEIQPLVSSLSTASTTAPPMKKKTSTTSLPALLKRNKSFISTNNTGAFPVLNKSHSTTCTSSANPSTSSKRQSLTSIFSGNKPEVCSTTSINNEKQVGLMINTNVVHDELIKALNLNTSTIDESAQQDFKLDLLPPIPLKSPSTEAQLSPSLPSRLTTPIIESEPFFSNSSSIDGESNDFDYHFFMQSSFSSTRRSRQNSSATSFSSHTTNNIPKTPNFYENTSGINSNQALLSYLNDPLSSKAVSSSKDSVSDKNELEDACCDQLAMNILDKVASDVSLAPQNIRNSYSPFQVDGPNSKTKKPTEWCI